MIVVELLLLIIAAVALALWFDLREQEKERAASPLTFYDQELDQ